MTVEPAAEGGASPERPTTVRPGLALSFAVILAVGVLAVGAIAGTLGVLVDGHDTQAAATTMPSSTMIAPDGILDLSTVASGTQAEFRYVAAHTTEYQQMNCWCGCAKAFSHRSLADCFVRRDGGWEAHGAGCGICLGEAAEARVALDAGGPIKDISATLDAHYGPSPATSANPGA